MCDYIPDETHIRHLMLFEYHRGSNATVATANICGVYPDALKVRKCQQWFSRFRSGNLDLTDGQHPGRPVFIFVYFFESGIRKLPERWTNVVEKDGDYIID